MKKCGYCGTRILLGGSRQGDVHYCNDTCRQRGALLQLTGQIPPEEVEAYIQKVFHGRCPQCGGEGPIDVHVSHRVYSLLVVTCWNSKPKVSCRRCGTKEKLLDTAFSLFLGWWGFPWGLIMTPVQIIRNIYGLCTSPAPTTKPSEQLETLLKIDLAMSIQQNKAALGKTINR